MCARRSASSTFAINSFRLGKDFGLQPRAEESRRIQIHTPPQKFGKFILHAKKVQPRCLSRSKLDQHIDIAVGAKIVAQHRSEKRQAADMIAAAEAGQLLL